MPEAAKTPTTTLSALIADPFVRDAFRRAERDDGAAFTVSTPREPVLAGGEAAAMEMAR